MQEPPHELRGELPVRCPTSDTREARVGRTDRPAPRARRTSGSCEPPHAWIHVYNSLLSLSRRSGPGLRSAPRCCRSGHDGIRTRKAHRGRGPPDRPGEGPRARRSFGQREHQARLRGGATPPAGLARWPLASRRGKPDPTTSEGVRRVLRGLSRAWVGGTVDFGSLDRIEKSLSEIIEPVSAPAQTADSSPRKYHQTAPLQRIGRVFWQTLTSG